MSRYGLKQQNGRDATVASFYKSNVRLTEQRSLVRRITCSMQNSSKMIAWCSLAMLMALYVVGAVSHGLLRHAVQTLPLWFPIALGFQEREQAKWSALPCFIFWLLIMTLIWLFLLGWARILTGHFSPVEIAMTIIVGIACLAGLTISLRWRTKVRPLAAIGVTALFGAMQILAMRISLIPYIATR
jgi:hypothetical protein